jgi:hypothetical protein
MQASHLGLLAGVVGDQGGLLAEGMGGDYRVERAHRSAAAFQIIPEIAIGLEGGGIKRQDHQGGEKRLQRLTIAD